MNRFRKALWVAALAVILGTATSARADIQLVITDVSTSNSYDSGVVAGNSTNFSGSIGDFSIAFSLASSNSPGGKNALAQQATATITNNGTTAETITITMSSNNFSSPVSPPPLEVLDTVSGSVANGTVTNGTAQGFASSTNNLLAKDFASTLLSFGPTGPSQSFSKSGDVTGFTSGAHYSLTFTETFTLTAGGSLTLTGGNVQTVVPAPAGLMLALSGLPVLGIGGWLRRRRKLA